MAVGLAPETEGLTPGTRGSVPGTEGLTVGMGGTAVSEEGRDWVGRLAEGSRVKKMVEMTVTVAGSPAAGSVACGLPVNVSPSEGVEEGLAEIVE